MLSIQIIKNIIFIDLTDLSVWSGGVVDQSVLQQGGEHEGDADQYPGHQRADRVRLGDVHNNLFQDDGGNIFNLND